MKFFYEINSLCLLLSVTIKENDTKLKENVQAPIYTRQQLFEKEKVLKQKFLKEAKMLTKQIQKLTNEGKLRSQMIKQKDKRIRQLEKQLKQMQRKLKDVQQSFVDLLCESQIVSDESDFE